MDDIGKVYTPTVIPDTAFPTPAVEQTSTTTTQTTANDIYSPTNTQDTPFPVPVIAQETISQTLNTKTKKILAEYNFAPSGAIGIGNFQAGVSGDVRITPDGIIARDISGNTTFALDGDTGDATFAGKIVSGSLVTGSLVIDDGGSITVADNVDEVVIDSKGLVSTNSFKNTVNTYGTTQVFTTTSYVDFVNSEIDITVERITHILYFVQCDGNMQEHVSDTGDGVIFLDIDGVITNAASIFIFSGNDFKQSYSMIYLATLPAGAHTIKLKARLETIHSGSPSLVIDEYTLTQVILGS